MLSDLWAVALVLVVLASLLHGLSVYQKRRAPHPEVVRKLVHAAMGCVTLSFPWIFHSPMSVVLLAVLSAGGLLAVKNLAGLRSKVGSVLCAVDRPTYGEVSFAAGIALLFMLAQHNPLLYTIPVLILTLSDSCSALVGIFLGKHKFSTSDGSKTAEGSLAFFLVTFLATAIPLAGFTALPAVHIVLIGALLAGLVMMFEAIAWRGLDNLLIPVSSYVLLSIYMQLDLAALAGRVLAAALLLAFALLWRNRTTLHDAAVIGAALACYMAVAVGGLPWLLAPLTVFVLYKFALPQHYHQMPRIHSVRSVITVASTGLLWLLASRLLHNDSYLFPYTLSFAANFAMIATAHLQLPEQRQPSASVVSCLLRSALLSWLLFFLPYMALSALHPNSVNQAAIALPLILLCAATFYFCRPANKETLTDVERWVRQFGIASCISPLALCHL